MLQAGARGQSRAIPAKRLTGPGYDGHAFWDTEILVLPMLTHTMPDAAAALRWRYSTLDKVKRRARELGQTGAMFPWRTINGDECSGYWPAGTAAVHVSADIAYATAQYIAATGDEQFETECGVELLVETARLWASLGHHHTSGEFRIGGVTGPDEYSALADNNSPKPHSSTCTICTTTSPAACTSPDSPERGLPVWQVSELCASTAAGWHLHRNFPTLTRLAFRILWRDSCLEVEVTGRNATYLLTCGVPLQLAHHGQTFTLGEDAVTLAVPTPAAPGAVAHPDSRAPRRRT